MSASNSLKDSMAQAYVSRAKFLSVHTGDPGTTGANELGGSSRQPLTWTARTGLDRGIQDSNTVSFAIAGSATITHVGIWDASGTFLDSQPVDFTFDSAGGTYSTSVTFTYGAV